MKRVATAKWFYFGGQPGFYYPGSLVVQSAGNQHDDACTWAYTPAVANDGILAVGGLDENGSEVTPQNGGYPYEAGSNYGSCVEMWALSKNIYSTWNSNSYTVLSGTSMAAPHVAGFAAALLEQNSNTQWTASSLEQAVRAKLQPAGTGALMPRF